MSTIVRLSDYRQRKRRTYFNRSELSRLLSLYSSRVATGEWRDYAIDHAAGIALFSVFRHTLERPAFTVAKVPGPHGAEFAVYDGTSRLTRAATLAEALTVFDRRLKLVRE